MKIRKGKAKMQADQRYWDLYYLMIARDVGRHSKCLSRKIGAVLVRDNAIISTGYNGPPIGYVHCADTIKRGEKKCPRKIMGFKSGEGLEICPAVHAERNVILAAARVGTPTHGSTLYCFCGFPCKDCLIELVNAGVERIVCIHENDRPYFYDKMSEELFNYYNKLGKLSTTSYEEDMVNEYEG